jgi:hypothetical protein
VLEEPHPAAARVTVTPQVEFLNAATGQVETSPADQVKLGVSVPVIIDPRQNGKTAQMEADAEKAQERLAAVNGTTLDQHEPPPGAEPGALTPAEAAAVPVLNGEGKPLQPLAAPGTGKKGCSVCHRVGHRKGSKACLGDKDPGPVVGDTAKEPKPCAHGEWSLNPVTGKWECGREDCHAVAADQEQAAKDAGPNGELAPDVPGETAEQRGSTLLQIAIHNRAAGQETTGDQAILSGDPDQIIHWWSPSSEGGTEEELEAALAAGRMVAGRDQEVADEFADEVLSDSEARWHEFLDEINEAPDKATLRDIRARAQKAGVWDDKLKMAGLDRIKSL